MENSTFVSPIGVVPPFVRRVSVRRGFLRSVFGQLGRLRVRHFHASAGMVSSIFRARIHTPAMLPPDRPTAVPMSVPARGSGNDLAQQVHEHERGEVDDLPQAAGAHDGGLALLGALQAAARQQRVAGGHEQAETPVRPRRRADIVRSTICCPSRSAENPGNAGAIS